jgi:hypothetical protein
MKPKYSFREGFPFPKKKAQVVGETLSSLAEESPLTAEKVVKEAKKIKNPLHEFFEWKDSKAAAEYRLEQARHLMRSIVVQYQPNKDSPLIRAFVTLTKEADGEGYEVTAKVLSDKEERKRQIERALKEAEEWRRRWIHLKEFALVFQALEKLKKKNGKKKKMRRDA